MQQRGSHIGLGCNMSEGGGHYRGLAFRVSKEEEKGEVRESEKYYKHESEKKEIFRFE